jgi:hypothetical protein
MEQKFGNKGMVFCFSKWKAHFDVAFHGTKFFLSHMVEVQLLYLNYQFYNNKIFTYLASKIGEVLDNELFNSYIKRLVIGLFTNR